MKRKVLNFGFILTLLLLVLSCEQLDVNQDVLQDSAMPKSTTVDDWTIMDDGAWAYSTGDVMYDICGEGDTYPFFESAMVTISNDENCIYVKVVAEEDWKVERLYFNAWPKGSPDINSYYREFLYQQKGLDADTVIFKVCDEWEDIECLVFNIKIRTVNDNGGSKYWWVTTDNSISYNYYLTYCFEDCGCYPYRTQTIGGWGAPARGNNPGAYRYHNFEGAFGDSLLVGLEEADKYILLTSAKAVENFLPSGGRPSFLNSDYVDPTSKELKNSFASQVIALTLSVGFDAYDEDFSAASANLGELEFKDEIGFETVQDILNEANRVLGGGDPGYYTLNELHAIVTMINEYYVDGELTGDGELFDDCWDYDNY